MDKQYIRMCDTPEIQGQWKPKVGDYCCATERTHNNDTNEVCAVNTISRTQGIVSLSLLGLKNKMQAAWFYPEENIWLPRQEDIQEMLPKQTTWFDNLFRLYDWITRERKNPFDGPIQQASSITALWLAFYMHEAHSKTWTEEGWR